MAVYEGRYICEQCLFPTVYLMTNNILNALNCHISGPYADVPERGCEFKEFFKGAGVRILRKF